MRLWFYRREGNNLPPTTNATQDQRGLTRFLSDFALRLQQAKALRPIIVEQSKADKETKGCDCFPPTAQLVILALSASNGTSIPTSPQLTIHRFLNARNITALQFELCPDLFRAQHPLTNIILPGHPTGAHPCDPRLELPKRISPLLPPPSSAGLSNAKQQSMRIQFLLTIEQDRLSKEEAR